jgi:membrane protease YdiL (CAAX protease family)
MSTSTKILVAALQVVAALLVIKRRSAKRGEDYAMGRPAIGPLLAWVAVYAVWMLGTNAIWGWRGPWDFTPWRQASLATDAGRLLAVGLLGPIGEELIFRGVLYVSIARTRAGADGAIIITAVGWALLHFDYPWAIQLMLAVGGLLLGAARRATKSVWVPVAMHIVWNLYAIW